MSCFMLYGQRNYVTLEVDSWCVVYFSMCVFLNFCMLVYFVLLSVFVHIRV